MNPEDYLPKKKKGLLEEMLAKFGTKPMKAIDKLDLTKPTTTTTSATTPVTKHEVLSGYLALQKEIEERVARATMAKWSAGTTIGGSGSGSVMKYYSGGTVHTMDDTVGMKVSAVTGTEVSSAVANVQYIQVDGTPIPALHLKNMQVVSSVDGKTDTYPARMFCFMETADGYSVAEIKQMSALSAILDYTHRFTDGRKVFAIFYARDLVKANIIVQEWIEAKKIGAHLSALGDTNNGTVRPSYLDDFVVSRVGCEECEFPSHCELFGCSSKKGVD